MKTKISAIFFAICLLLTIGLSTALAADAPTYNIDFPVQIKSGVSVEMGAVVVLNPNKVNNGSTIMVVNGIGQTANTFVPFAASVLNDKVGKKISRFVLLNYPGHGNSSLPMGAKLGDLSLDDYVTSVIESIRFLGTIDMAPDFVLGHSLGAEMLNIAQDRLIKQGSSLRKAFNIRGAIFVAPDIVGPSPWAFTDSGTAAAVASQLAVPDANNGVIVVFPPPVWVALFFSDLNNKIPAGAPTPEQAVAKGFIAIDSAAMASDFLGIGKPRPNVASSIFNSQTGTVASLVSLEQDALYSDAEHRALYTYLTGDNGGSLYFRIKGATTVHNQHLIETTALFDVIKKTFAKAKN